MTFCIINLASRNFRQDQPLESCAHYIVCDADKLAGEEKIRYNADYLVFANKKPDPDRSDTQKEIIKVYEQLNTMMTKSFDENNKKDYINNVIKCFNFQNRLLHISEIYDKAKNDNMSILISNDRQKNKKEKKDGDFFENSRIEWSKRETIVMTKLRDILSNMYYIDDKGDKTQYKDHRADNIIRNLRIKNQQFIDCTVRLQNQRSVPFSTEIYQDFISNSYIGAAQFICCFMIEKTSDMEKSQDLHNMIEAFAKSYVERNKYKAG